MSAPKDPAGYNPYFEPLFTKACSTRVEVKMKDEAGARKLQRNLNYYRAARKKEVEALARGEKFGLGNEGLAEMGAKLKEIQQVEVRVLQHEGLWKVVLESRFDQEESQAIMEALAQPQPHEEPTTTEPVQLASDDPMGVLNKYRNKPEN